MTVRCVVRAVETKPPKGQRDLERVRYKCGGSVMKARVTLLFSERSLG